MARRTRKAKLIKNLNLSLNWDDHVDSVRPVIQEIDRRQVESIAKAPFIVVSNAIK